ncbi:MAG: hypothetical protein AAF725_09635, partial [Acidobacteriota bacterium]
MLKTPLLSVRRRYRAALVTVLIGLAAGLSWWTERALRQSGALTVVSTRPYHQLLTAPRAASADPALRALRVPSFFALERGQTMGQLLRQEGVEPGQIQPALAALSEHLDFRRIRSGEAGLAYRDGQGDLERLRLRLERKGWVTLERRQGSWRSSMREFVRSVETRHISGSLETFLFNDVEKAGGLPQLAVAMSAVLQWDL